mgnify:FL=1|tara:strand:- start:837 stop:1022 length:186 start_codon:yes stop_codon:yes gene_type:complete
MNQDPSQQKAAAIATIAYLAAAGCFFAIASRVDGGAVGYAIAGGLFGLAAVASFLRWRAAK